ncbi:MAG: type II toxin-antitoxin system Phd/YefM family antitoxin [Alphaproteobacteria bacterium]|nr:type II toxin-antitoxin system Phd/YefM family antitoxin [Alphaproteobacteria bacterium]
MRHVSAADANRHFSQLLRNVQEGESVTVTSHGRPVAVILPATPALAEPKRLARANLFKHLSAQPAMGISFDRDELYEDEA